MTGLETQLIQELEESNKNTREIVESLNIALKWNNSLLGNFENQLNSLRDDLNILATYVRKQERKQYPENLINEIKTLRHEVYKDKHILADFHRNNGDFKRAFELYEDDIVFNSKIEEETFEFEEYFTVYIITFVKQYYCALKFMNSQELQNIEDENKEYLIQFKEHFEKRYELILEENYTKYKELGDKEKLAIFEKLFYQKDDETVTKIEDEFFYLEEDLSYDKENPLILDDVPSEIPLKEKKGFIANIINLFRKIK